MFSRCGCFTSAAPRVFSGGCHLDRTQPGHRTGAGPGDDEPVGDQARSAEHNCDIRSASCYSLWIHRHRTSEGKTGPSWHLHKSRLQSPYLRFGGSGSIGTSSSGLQPTSSSGLHRAWCPRAVSPGVPNWDGRSRVLQPLLERTPQVANGPHGTGLIGWTNRLAVLGFHV